MVANKNKDGECVKENWDGECVKENWDGECIKENWDGECVKGKLIRIVTVKTSMSVVKSWTISLPFMATPP